MPSLKCKIFFGLPLEDPENFPSSGIWYELKLLLLSPCVSDKNKLYLSLQSWLQKTSLQFTKYMTFQKKNISCWGNPGFAKYYEECSYRE